MFRASPQPKHPTPKTAYPNNNAGFLPKMSLSLPYSGWKDVKVKKYLYAEYGYTDTKPALEKATYPVAIHDVLFNDFRSLPILP